MFKLSLSQPLLQVVQVVAVLLIEAGHRLVKDHERRLETPDTAFLRFRRLNSFGIFGQLIAEPTSFRIQLRADRSPDGRRHGGYRGVQVGQSTMQEHHGQLVPKAVCSLDKAMLGSVQIGRASCRERV